MQFYLLLLCGVAGGVLGGMGMGGGTALIPLLTLGLGLNQSLAQGLNLISFLPMSLLALRVHRKNGLLKGDGLIWIIPAAALFSVPAAFLATVLPSEMLKKAFGIFLVALSFVFFAGQIKAGKARRTPVK